MFGRLTAVTVVLLAASGCTSAVPTPTPAPPPVRPAALAGGACRHIEFDKVSAALGARYTIAAAAKTDKTNTCVVRTEESPIPEVVLSVTPTKADSGVFKDIVKPKGSTAVGGLGKMAYQLITPAKGTSGPVVEVGWLTGDARLLFLRLTLPPGQDAAGVAPKLVSLAKEIDKSSL
ncbi:MAG: hypothetical protein HOV79_02455 [Hamadaea sp.]|nr:hypothetical protein [Hamadaea sp.]